MGKQKKWNTHGFPVFLWENDLHMVWKIQVFFEYVYRRHCQEVRAWQTSQTSVVSWCFGIIGILSNFGVFRSDGNGIKTPKKHVDSQFIAVKERANMGK